MLPLSAGAVALVQSSKHASFVTVEAMRSQVTSFYDVFGYLGVTSIVVFVFSALWTLVLAVIQVYPNEMANKIMHTAEFDNGDFWLLPKPDIPIVASSVVILALIAVGYLALAVYMVVGLRRARHSSAVVSSSDTKAQQIARADAGDRGRREKRTEMFAWLTRQITNPTQLQRHYYVGFTPAAVDVVER